jgi:hypothetical protein
MTYLREKIFFNFKTGKIFLFFFSHSNWDTRIGTPNKTRTRKRWNKKKRKKKKKEKKEKKRKNSIYGFVIGLGKRTKAKPLIFIMTHFFSTTTTHFSAPFMHLSFYNDQIIMI